MGHVYPQVATVPEWCSPHQLDHMHFPVPRTLTFLQALLKIRKSPPILNACGSFNSTQQYYGWHLPEVCLFVQNLINYFSKGICHVP